METKGQMRSGGERQGLFMALVIIALIAVTVTTFVGWFGLLGGGISADTVKAGEVAANGVSYYGRATKIYGLVARSLTDRIFEISDPSKNEAFLPVLLKEGDMSVALGDTVVVQGTPTAFDMGRIRQDYGMEVPEELAMEWKNRPVVIAENVQKFNWLRGSDSQLPASSRPVRATE